MSLSGRIKTEEVHGFTRLSKRFVAQRLTALLLSVRVEGKIGPEEQAILSILFAILSLKYLAK